MRKLCIVVSTLMVLASTSVFANPTGLRGPEVGKKLWNFNVIVKTNGWTDVGNACNGARIFFDTEPHGGINSTITWVLDPAAQQNFQIVDCNGTDGAASVRVDENLGNAIVAIRVVGPKSSNLKFTCLEVVNPTLTPGEDLCVMDEVNLNKSKSFTPVLKNIAEGEYENVLWTFDPTGTWKIFQVFVDQYIYP